MNNGTYDELVEETLSEEELIELIYAGNGNGIITNDTEEEDYE